MKAGPEVGNHVLSAPEFLDALAQVGECCGKLRQVLALELTVSLGVRIVAHATANRSSTRRALATNVAAVLQCPRTSLPFREARIALRSSTTRMTGIPGQARASGAM
jgi:hypothetical protein